MTPDLPCSVGFPWRETAARIARLATVAPLAADPTGHGYVGHDAAGLAVALRPPLLLLGGDALPAPEAWGPRAEAGPGRFAVLLLQAGAASLGLVQDDDLLEHKVFKRYVVRGKGRAQPTHLKTRGKSRQGSRLRLRNAERLLEEVNERLGDWWRRTPPPARLFVACPPRLQADLSRVTPPPPIDADDPRRVRIPIDVHVPNHAELVRVLRSIARGREWGREPPPASVEPLQD